MASEAECRPLGVFKCQLCSVTAPYSYVGQKPPDTQAVVLLEESYIMKDPFTSDKGRFLVLGSRCSLCGRLVCVGPVGVQLVLLQEVLPPLCSGQCQRFPSGDPARLGEKERPQAALQSALSLNVSTVGARLAAAPAQSSWAGPEQRLQPVEAEEPCREGEQTAVDPAWAAGLRPWSEREPPSVGSSRGHLCTVEGHTPVCA